MSISVIIPTYNEADRILPLLNSLQSSSQGHLEEIIVANAANSEDRISEVVSEMEYVTCLDCMCTSRASQMNEAAKLAKGDILYFVHADVLPPRGCLTDVCTAIDGGVDYGLFSYQFDSNHPLLKINSYFTRFDGIFTGGGDQTFFIKKEVFEAMGGYMEKLAIMEDFDLFWKLRKAGYKYKIIDNCVKVSARKYENNSYFKVNLVNLITIGLFRVGVSSKRLKKFYQRILK